MSENIIPVIIFVGVLVMIYIAGNMLFNETVSMRFSNATKGFIAWKLPNGSIVYEDYSSPTIASQSSVEPGKQ